MRVTCFDIEATDLGANFGRLLCCSFVDLGSDQVETFRRDRVPWKGRKITDDARLAVAIRDRLEASDIVVSWNGILYDVPFINARLVAAGERPVRLTKDNGVQHLDLMYYAGGQAMRLQGRSLERVSKFLHADHSKTPLTPEVWAEASAGDPESFESVVEHCEADVLVLRDVFPHLAPFVKKMTFTLAEVYPFIGGIASRKVGAK